METAQETTGYLTTSVRHFMSNATAEVDLPLELSVEEATRELTRAIGLPTIDIENRPQHYELFVRRPDGTAEHLNPSARIADAVKPGETIEPLPEVVPGASGR